MNPAFASLTTTIFEAMSGLAREHDAINLGQGFPDDVGPEDVRRHAAEAAVNGNNQYPPMMGIPALREAIAAHYGRFHGVSLDWAQETMVTSGATEALAAAILSCVSPGDEVVLFQPMYDSYLPMIRLAGGVPKFVTLKPPHWRFNEEDLKAAFTPKTRAVILNNPLNPSGSVFSREDLALLGRYCETFGAICIADEVWEHLVFDDRPFVSALSLPSLRQRTIKIGSAGKIFSLTGWKVGLVCAAPDILKVMAKAHQYLTFTTPPNLQAAVAYGLGKADGYFSAMRASFQRSRDYLANGLAQAGLVALQSQSTYFINVDLTKSGIEEDDVSFCQRMVREKGVAAIPVSAFYAIEPVTSVVRFCFAKQDATLDAAIMRLKSTG